MPKVYASIHSFTEYLLYTQSLAPLIASFLNFCTRYSTPRAADHEPRCCEGRAVKSTSLSDVLWVAWPSKQKQNATHLAEAQHLGGDMLTTDDFL